MLGARFGLRTALVPWIVARVVVLAALGVSRELSSDGRLSAKSAAVVHAGLLSWDAGWYEAIAERGYGGAGSGSLRFFPLFPAMARGLSEVTGISVGSALVLIANVAALGAAAALACLVGFETGDRHLARRAAWLLCLAPPAFTFVMGYAAPVFVLFAIGSLFCLRKRRFWRAAWLAILAGASWPVGALLFFPALIEAARTWGSVRSTGFRRATRPSRSEFSAKASAVAAVVGGPLGCGAFLAWSGWRYKNAFAPLRIQEQSNHRGAVADPFRTLAHDASLLVHGQHLGTALHLPWVGISLILLVVVAARWPASYTAFAFFVLAVALTASNLDSFERYALCAFPLVLGAASVVRTPRQETAVLVVSAAGLVGYAVLAFTGLYVP